MTPDLNSRGQPIGRGVLLCTAEFIAHIAMGLADGGSITVIDNRVPEDAIVVSKYYDQDRDCFIIILESPSFPPVPEGAIIPILPRPIFQVRSP
jgi:hypothetical protein